MSARLAGPLEGVHLTLDPARVILDLNPWPATNDLRRSGGRSPLRSPLRSPRPASETTGYSAGYLESSLWHRVEPYPGAVRVALVSELRKPALIRCSVRPLDPGWNRDWVIWRYAIRRVPEHLGGDAVERQDRLEDDDRTLLLLLLPGERREATLEFHAYLDGETRTGDFGYEIVIEQADTGAEAARPGLLTLRTPASLLLQHLPSIYQEAMLQERDRSPAALDTPFFERFLKGFEDALQPIQETLGRLDQLFGGQSAPAEMLPWLATWVALALDDNWPELRRRRLIREAVELYKWRGTRKGLSRYLELYTGIVPEIDDQPVDGMKLGPGALLGTERTILGGLPNHCFKVRVKVPKSSPATEETVRAIIESEKPAHTAYELKFEYI